MSRGERDRPARRPAGWRAPGPRPAAVDIPLSPEESLDYLSGDWRIVQRRRGHRWSLDDLVTAWVAAGSCGPEGPARFLDLGCGIGSVLLLLAWRFPAACGVGLEAQALSLDLARRSLKYNGTGDRLRLVAGDLRDPGVLPPGERFELVSGTPPYFPPGTVQASKREQCDPCRLERRGGVEDYCAAAARWLDPGGVAVLCAAAGQRGRVQAGAQAAGLALRAALTVVPKEGKAPLLSVFSLTAGDPPGEALERGLTVRDGAGRWTPQFAALRREMGLPDRTSGCG